MPYYMDIHDTTGAEAKDIAGNHKKDLDLQENYNCKSLYFWHDIPNCTGFCVFEASNKESVINLHEKSHGNTPSQIIEVDLNKVESFLGKIADAASSKMNTVFDGYINASVHRAIMFLKIENPLLLNLKSNKNKIVKLIEFQKKVINKSLLKFEGIEIYKENNQTLASFLSRENAVNSALEIQTELSSFSKEKNLIFNFSIGLSFGAPVTNSENLFGDVIKSAEELAYAAGKNQINISSSLGKIYNEIKLKKVIKNNSVKIFNSKNEIFLEKLIETLNKNWNEEDFNIESLVKLLNLSRSQLYRKIIKIMGKSPNNLIKEFRLEKALELIENKKGNISEISYEVSFNNPAYFSRCFKKKYGILPSEYAGNLIS